MSKPSWWVGEREILDTSRLLHHDYKKFHENDYEYLCCGPKYTHLQFGWAPYHRREGRSP